VVVVAIIIRVLISAGRQSWLGLKPPQAILEGNLACPQSAGNQNGVPKLDAQLKAKSGPHIEYRAGAHRECSLVY